MNAVPLQTRHHKVVIGGCARNVAPYLERVFRNIERLTALFDTFKIIVYTDVSQDQTWHWLEEKQQCYSDQMVVMKNTCFVSEFKTHRLARARNAIVGMIEENYSNYDFFINLDMDAVCHRPILLDTVVETLSRSDWDAISFNRLFYYDLWALSFEPYIHNYFGHKLNHNLPSLRPLIKTIRSTLLAQLEALPAKQLLPVYSAFNGFAIYRVGKILGCRYNGQQQCYQSAKKYEAYTRATGLEIDPARIENCEHIGFHWDMIRKHQARIRISPERVFRFIDHENSFRGGRKWWVRPKVTRISPHESSFFSTHTHTESTDG